MRTNITGQLPIHFEEKWNLDTLLTREEREEAQKHRQEIDRQCRVLIFNCPWRALKFLRQRRELMAEIDQKLFEGFYLQGES